jgi:hypothetical protein
VLEPLKLSLVEGVVDLEAVGGTVGALALQGERHARLEVWDALNGNPVEGPDLYPNVLQMYIILAGHQWRPWAPPLRPQSELTHRVFAHGRSEGDSD